MHKADRQRKCTKYDVKIIRLLQRTLWLLPPVIVSEGKELQITQLLFAIDLVKLWERRKVKGSDTFIIIIGEML